METSTSSVMYVIHPNFLKKHKTMSSSVMYVTHPNFLRKHQALSTLQPMT